MTKDEPHYAEVKEQLEKVQDTCNNLLERIEAVCLETIGAIKTNDALHA